LHFAEAARNCSLIYSSTVSRNRGEGKVIQVLVGKPERMEHLVDIYVNERTILKCITKIGWESRE